MSIIVDIVDMSLSVIIVEMSLSVIIIDVTFFPVSATERKRKHGRTVVILHVRDKKPKKPVETKSDVMRTNQLMNHTHSLECLAIQ